MSSFGQKDPSELKLDEVLRSHALRDPHGLALLYAREPQLGRSCTWQELDGLAEALAERLRERGTERGERVGIVLADCPECIAAVYGIFRAGAVVVPIDSAWGGTSIRATLDHARPSVVVAESAQALEECGLGVYVAEHEPFPREQSARRETDWDGSVDDIAMIAFTSGTTTEPKGVVIRHRHFRAAYTAGAELLGLRGKQRFGCIFRLSGLGILGINYFLAHQVGAATVVLPEFSLATAKSFWEQVAEHRVEFVYLVPAVVQIINKIGKPMEAARGGMANVVCVTAAAPIAPHAHAEFQSRFGVALRNAYGLTEASFAVFFGELESGGKTASHSIGRAQAVEVRLLDANGGVIEGPGSGELEMRGPMVTDGYWENPEATADLMHDGWLRTGDTAQRDEHGRYQICGRIKDVVIRGGFNIHLAEVEEALLAHPEVLGACAVGVADPLTGEELYAVIQTVTGSSEVQIVERWARQRLGQSRAPRRIFVSSELPRNGAGKIVRAKVAEEVRAKLRSGVARAGATTPG